MTVGGPKPVIHVAACALLDADGRILIARRPEGKPMAGLWEFPGGKIEANETPEQAVVRELREELGVEPCERCLHPFAFVSHPYACQRMHTHQYQDQYQHQYQCQSQYAA